MSERCRYEIERYCGQNRIVVYFDGCKYPKIIWTLLHIDTLQYLLSTNHYGPDLKACFMVALDECKERGLLPM